MEFLKFDGNIYEINNNFIVHIPQNISKKFSSRGMVMVEGKINEFEFKSPLEPDGLGGHFLLLSIELLNTMNLKVDDNVMIEIVQIKEFLEPEIPSDLKEYLLEENVLDKWEKITLKGQWDWIRWIRFTNNTQTRDKRAKIASLKIKDGDKNPCCFDQTRCTITEVSKNGILLKIK